MAKIGREALFGSMLAALLLGPIIGDARAQTAMLAEGRMLAEKNCARCHAIGKDGASPHRDAPPFRAIAAKGQVDDLQEALAEGIMVGHPDMPEFELEPAQITAFLAYLKSLAPPAD